MIKDNAGFGIDYSLTIERITERVNIGIPAFTRTARRVVFDAVARYGDNQLAGDGIAGDLHWRLRAGSVRWKRLDSSTVLDGRLAFTGKLPKSSIGRKVRCEPALRSPGVTERAVRSAQRG